MASTLDGTALMLSAGAGSVAAGVPLTVMPAPLVAAGGLAMYLESGALRDYLLFVAGALGTGVERMIISTQAVSGRSPVVLTYQHSHQRSICGGAGSTAR